ncbi:MAG TPA: JAB domain-containing protein [Anaeromyxobacter sp.]|nr:JAB domain-containing protein [Anaeromyxobacter sp.]
MRACRAPPRPRAASPRCRPRLPRGSRGLPLGPPRHQGARHGLRLHEQGRALAWRLREAAVERQRRAPAPERASRPTTGSGGCASRSGWAHGVVFVHNHPSSGDPSPRDDADLIDRLRAAADLFGVLARGHVIVAANGYCFFHRGWALAEVISRGAPAAWGRRGPDFGERDRQRQAASARPG